MKPQCACRTIATVRIVIWHRFTSFTVDELACPPCAAKRIAHESVVSLDGVEYTWEWV